MSAGGDGIGRRPVVPPVRKKRTIVWAWTALHISMPQKGYRMTKNAKREG